MIIETVIPAYAKGVAAALAEAGLRSGVSIRRAADGVVNVLPNAYADEDEERHLQALLDVLEGAEYVAHRCQPMPWLVRVTGKRKNVRVSS